MAGQCSRKCPGSSSTVIPSTPGLPRFLRTCASARLQLSRSQARSIHCSLMAGLSSRPVRFGPFAGDFRGFTPPIAREGQHRLGVLPHSADEKRRSTHHSVRSGLQPLRAYYAVC